MAAEDLDDQYTCYYPDKSIDLKGFACNGTTLREGGASACCLPNDICFSNGACYQDWSGVMYRLSCTDPTFRDPACAPWCLLDGLLRDMAWIETCQRDPRKACCVMPGETECCDAGTGRFDFDHGYISAVLNDKEGTNRLGPLNASWPWTTPSLNTSCDSSNSSNGSSSSSQALPPLVPATQGLSCTTNSQSAQPNSHPQLRGWIIAPIVVLSVLLAAALSALGLLWMRCKRLKMSSVPDAPAPQRPVAELSAMKIYEHDGREIRPRSASRNIP